ncbi:MAG: hypothetical protein PHG25_02435 [Candidatus Pacebacteria bacterium]|nr:hypothetical protein [Candidatus Paceibacterota bacterium]
MEKFNQEHDSTQQLLKDIEAQAEKITESRINPLDFKGHPFFKDEEIEDDLRRCQEKEIKIADQRLQLTPEQLLEIERGVSAEYTFRQALENHGWLADKVTTIVASQFDDYFKGIDSIAQIDLGPGRYEHIGFALDFSTSIEDLGNKLRHTFDAIDKGYSPSVKYFDSEKTGKLKNFRVPRIVIGGSKEVFHRLAEYTENKEAVPSSGNKTQYTIEEDPFKHIVFGEIIAQLSTFCNRLEKVIKQAQVQRLGDVEKRATESLAMHMNSLKIIQELAKERGSTMDVISKSIRADQFAVKMGTALSALSLTPIELKKDAR